MRCDPGKTFPEVVVTLLELWPHEGDRGTGSLSEVLRAVGRGEHVRVTSRGKALADIVPAGEAAVDERLRQLVLKGRVVLPARARPTRAPQLAKSDRSATAVVLADRESQR